MVTILNLTPHTIKVIGAEGETLAVFAPTGTVARAVQADVCVGKVEVDGLELMLVRTEFGAPVDLPEPQDGVMLIVSFATANAAKAANRRTDDLLLTSGPVRDDSGRVIGCRRFAVL